MLSLVLPNQTSYPITGVSKIGRALTCDILLDDNSVSGLHAQIEVISGAAQITDLGSTNGTFVNGVKISSMTTLSVGSLIQFGLIETRLTKTVFPQPNQVTHIKKNRLIKVFYSLSNSVKLFLFLSFLFSAIGLGIFLQNIPMEIGRIQIGEVLSKATSDFIPKERLQPLKSTFGNFSVEVIGDSVRGIQTFVQSKVSETISNPGSSWKYSISFRCVDGIADVQIISSNPLSQNTNENLFYHKFSSGEPSGGIYWTPSERGFSVFLPSKYKNQFFEDAIKSKSLTVRDDELGLRSYEYSWDFSGFNEAKNYLYCFFN